MVKAVMALLVSTALAVAWWQTSQAQQRVALARKALSHATDDLDGARVDAAHLALRANDVVGALARLKGANSAEANGLRLLAHASAGPSLVWSARTEAGCAAVVWRGDEVLCATLGGVEVRSVASPALGELLKVGPVGWQRALFVDTAGVVCGGDDRRLHLFAPGQVQPDTRVGPFRDAITSVVRGPKGLSIGLFDGAVVDERGTVLQQGAGPVHLFGQQGVLVHRWADETMVTWADRQPQRIAGRSGAATMHADALVLAVGRQVVVVNRDGSVNQMFASPARITSMASDGLLLIGSDDGVVRWLQHDGPLAGQLRLESSVTSLSARVDGQAVLLAVALADRRLEVWRLPLSLPDAQRAETVGAAFDSGGAAVQALEDGQLWSHGAALPVGLTTSARALAASSSSHGAASPRLALGDERGSLFLLRWNGEVEPLGTLGSGVTAIALSADGRFAAASRAGTVRVGRVASSSDFTDTVGPVARSLAFSNDGQLLAVGRDDKRVEVLSAKGVHSTMGPFDAEVSALLWSEQLLIAATADGQVHLSTGQRWAPSRRSIGALAVTPEGLLAVGAEDGVVTLVSLSGGNKVAVIPVERGSVMALASHDGTLGAVSADGHVWQFTLSLANGDQQASIK
jgi:WD40 repeat protein